jgi:hypothetical protein
MAGAVPPTELILAASSNRVGQTPNERRVARDVERTPDRDAGRCSQSAETSGCDSHAYRGDFRYAKSGHDRYLREGDGW